MSWQAARDEAKRLAEKVSLSPDQTLEIPYYTSEEAYRNAVPEPQWSLLFHTQVQRALARELRTRRQKAKMVAID